MTKTNKALHTRSLPKGREGEANNTPSKLAQAQREIKHPPTQRIPLPESDPVHQVHSLLNQHKTQSTV